jgi:hypothetical protein
LGTVGSSGCAGFGVGTGFYQSEILSLINCTATGNKRYGAFFEKQAAAGSGFLSRGIKITGGTFDTNQWGIGDNGVDGIIVDGVVANSNVADGYIVNGSSINSIAGINGTIKNSEFAHNGGYGINPASPATYTLTNNNLHDNGSV